MSDSSANPVEEAAAAAPAPAGAPASADISSVSSVEETQCPACGVKVDVRGIAPFSRIACPQCGAELDVPGRLGHFILLRRLGSGGMGTTFLAQDETLGRKCAVKVVQASVGADEKAFAAFKAEAQNAARLNHPHVAQVYSFGKEGDNPYLAMELVPGGDLASLAEKSPDPLDPAFVLRVGMEIAEGLKAAEDAGLFHGDVKPDNILFDESGTAKLVDFGIASRSSQGGAGGGELWGTPYYIAPEKVQKKTNSARSDIYSLGATLYHAIAGRPPYDGADAVEVIKARFKGPPPPLETIRPDIEPEVSRIVSRMMYNDLFMRYPNYNSLIGDLKKYLDGVSESRKAGPLSAVSAAARRTTGSISDKVPAESVADSAESGGKKKLVIRKGGLAEAEARREAAAAAAPASSSGGAPRLVPDEKPRSGVSGVKVVFFCIVGVIALLLIGGVGFLVHMVRSSAAAEKHAAEMVASAQETAESYFQLGDELERQRKLVDERAAAMDAPLRKVAEIVREATGEDWSVPDLEPPAPEAPAPEPDASAAPAASASAGQDAKAAPADKHANFTAYASKLADELGFDSPDQAKDMIRAEFIKAKSANKELDIEEYSRRMLAGESVAPESEPAAGDAAASEDAASDEAAPADNGEAGDDAAAPAEPPLPPNPLLAPIDRYVIPHAKAIRAAQREAERLAVDDVESFDEIKPTFSSAKIEAGLRQRQRALEGRQGAKARLEALVASASKSLIELQKGVQRVENAAKPLLRAKERQEKEEAERRAEEERQAAIAAEAARKAEIDREEVERVQDVARTHWALLGKGQFDEFQKRMHRMDEELRTEAGREELEWTCRRAAALDSVRAWVVKDLRDNGVIKLGFRRRFDILGASPDGSKILLKGAPSPDIPVDKLTIGDWVSLFWTLLEDRPNDRKGLRTYDRGEQLKNAAVYCYVFGQDESGVLDDRALETCRRFADKALSYRTGLESDIMRLIPPLAEPRPSEDDSGDAAADSEDAAAAAE